MRREMTASQLALALAALVFLLAIYGHAGWRHVMDYVHEGDGGMWEPWKPDESPPRKPWLVWGGDAQRITPYNFSAEWLEWNPRTVPWWELDERLGAPLEVSLLVCMRKTPESPERVC
jgi:hypothetical protein